MAQRVVASRKTLATDTSILYFHRRVRLPSGSSGRTYAAELAVHEMSIVQALIDQVTTEVEKSQHQGRVLRLELVVGRLSGVHVAALRFAFELLSRETLVEAAELRIEQPRAVCECHSCGIRQEIEELILSCATCGSDEVSISGGQDLLLQSIELED